MAPMDIYGSLSTVFSAPKAPREAPTAPPEGVCGDSPGRRADLAGYAAISSWGAFCPVPARAVEGRAAELAQVRAALARPESSNVVLLGRAGTGKSTIAYEAARTDGERLWLELDVASMTAGLANPDELGARLKQVFSEASGLASREDADVVLFIDEFHQLQALSYGAVEALKPLLVRTADTRVHVVAATTMEEWAEHLSANKALAERFGRVTVPPMDHDACVSVVQAFLERHLEEGCRIPPGFAASLVKATDDYMPADAQPRKSVLAANEVVGEHRVSGAPLDRAMLALAAERLCGAKLEACFDPDEVLSDLEARVFAQGEACGVVAAQLRLAAAGFCDPGKPKASFLFCGSTGVGKTELARTLAASLFGTEEAMVRLDMSEYVTEASCDRFRRELCQRVWERPFSVVLLDEVDKAHPAAVRLLLQVLDDARLSDRNGRVTSFSSCYICCTTNAGSDIFADVARYDSDASQDLLTKLDPLVRRRLTASDGVGGKSRFPPELLGRFDAVCPFRPLSEATSMRIVGRELDRVAAKAKRLHGVEVSFAPRVADFFESDRIDNAAGVKDAAAGGARRIRRLVEKEVEVPVADAVMRHPEAASLYVDVEGELLSEQPEEAALEFRRRIESCARIVVEAGSWR